MTVDEIRTILTMSADELADIIARNWDACFVNGLLHDRRPSRDSAEQLRSAVRRAARRTSHKVATHAVQIDDEWVVSALWRDAPEPAPDEKRARERALREALERFHRGEPAS